MSKNLLYFYERFKSHDNTPLEWSQAILLDINNATPLLAPAEIGLATYSIGFFGFAFMTISLELMLIGIGLLDYHRAQKGPAEDTFIRTCIENISGR